MQHAMIEAEVQEKAKRAKLAARSMALLSSGVKDKALGVIAAALEDQTDIIVAANKKDVTAARDRGVTGALIDRLTLNADRVQSMADGLREIAELPDPVGETEHMWRRPNGLEVGRVRVPLGVIGIIYEARPNVTADAAGLCLKAGNAAVLRGGSEAIHSNMAIAQTINRAGQQAGLPEGFIELIEQTDRAAATAMMRQNGLIDVLIPRGGPGLIRSVVENATIPVIETGAGNCHIYVAANADMKTALPIIINAKVQRPGVCNAVETLLVHESVAADLLPAVYEQMTANRVAVRGCGRAKSLIPSIAAANDEDWATEYLDLILAVKVVDNTAEAIDHIAQYGTGHSEAILTSDYGEARRFTQAVDAAAVYVNASTRFTDGQQFGFGAEIGISTQKLHARGPMGLTALTSTKYVVLGEGQIRG